MIALSDLFSSNAGHREACSLLSGAVYVLETPLQMVIFRSFHFIKMSSVLVFPQRGTGSHERVGSSSHCGPVTFTHSYFHPFCDCCVEKWLLIVHSDEGTYQRFAKLWVKASAKWSVKTVGMTTSVFSHLQHHNFWAISNLPEFKVLWRGGQRCESVEWWQIDVRIKSKCRHSLV